MINNRVFRNSSIYPCLYWDDIFTDEELDTLENMVSTLNFSEGKILGEDEGEVEYDSNTKKTIRNSKISFIHFEDNTSWIFNKLFMVATAINDNFYNFELTGFDHFQYTLYDEGSNYIQHADLFYGNIKTDPYSQQGLHRKLSFSLLLNDPNDFSGGDLIILPDGKTSFSAEQKRGRTIGFPSWVIHEVTPIVSGIRKSIVFWALGQKFK